MGEQEKGDVGSLIQFPFCISWNDWLREGRVRWRDCARQGGEGVSGLTDGRWSPRWGHLRAEVVLQTLGLFCILKLGIGDDLWKQISAIESLPSS